jgi:hypothetical protein
MTTSSPLKTTSSPLIASSLADLPRWSSPPAVAPSMPRRSRYGSRSGPIIAPWVLRIIVGVALLCVAGVLMAVHLWSLLAGRRDHPVP